MSYIPKPHKDNPFAGFINKLRNFDSEMKAKQKSLVIKYIIPQEGFKITGGSGGAGRNSEGIIKILTK